MARPGVRTPSYRIFEELVRITPEASFVDDLGADSLDTVELVMALEEEFEIDIPDEEAEKIVTFQHVIEYIKANAPDAS